jgi:hypothetical protein
MLRFHSSIHFEDKVLIRQTISRDTAFHEDTPSSRPEIDRENRSLGGDPDSLRV